MVSEWAWNQTREGRLPRGQVASGPPFVILLKEEGLIDGGTTDGLGLALVHFAGLDS